MREINYHKEIEALDKINYDLIIRYVKEWANAEVSTHIIKKGV